LFAKASERALAALRLDTFSRIIRLPMATLNQRRVGELASRLANDVEAMRETLVVDNSDADPSLGDAAALPHPHSANVGEALTLHGRHDSRCHRHDRDFRFPHPQADRKAQDNLAASQVVVDESLQSIVSVKAFRNESYEMARYDKNLGEYLRTVIRAAVPRASFIAFIIFAFSVALILVTWFAMRMLNDGHRKRRADPVCRPHRHGRRLLHAVS
jgi:ATP-binding cassette subfamily B protein